MNPIRVKLSVDPYVEEYMTFAASRPDFADIHGIQEFVDRLLSLYETVFRTRDIRSMTGVERAYQYVVLDRGRKHPGSITVADLMAIRGALQSVIDTSRPDLPEQIARRTDAVISVMELLLRLYELQQNTEVVVGEVMRFAGYLQTPPGVKPVSELPFADQTREFEMRRQELQIKVWQSENSGLFLRAKAKFATTAPEQFENLIKVFRTSVPSVPEYQFIGLFNMLLRKLVDLQTDDPLRRLFMLAGDLDGAKDYATRKAIIEHF